MRTGKSNKRVFSLVEGKFTCRLKWFIPLLMLFGVGCGEQSYEGRSAVVKGNVLLGGAPLTSGNVLFMMDDGHAATSPLASDGTYSTQCRPGKYKVAVTPPELIDPLAAASNPAKKVSIPSRYQDLGTSGISFDVKAGDNQFEIKLEK